MQKYPGDVRSALMYYHGGPDQKLWGPKTHAYADSILRHVGGASNAQSGAGSPISGKPLAADASADDTAKFIGGQVALGQPMPPLGMGKEAAAMRRAILAEATKQWKAMGISPGEANVIAAQNKSGLAELAKIAQMKATVQTAENTASANASQVLTLLGSAGSYWITDFQRMAAGGTPSDRRCQGFRLRCRGQDARDRICARDERRRLTHACPIRLVTRPTPYSHGHDAGSVPLHDQSDEDRHGEPDQGHRAGAPGHASADRSGGRSSLPEEEGWQTLPSGLKVREIH
jgi:hypothetical protein